MARTASGTPSTTAPARRPARRTSQLAWLRAGDVRLVISHQDAQDRRILKALDTLVKAKPAVPASAPARRRKLAA
ncbi:MAG: hypothetical protein JWN31_692 [Frankiales bacterium]|nr:hypothetical protein [Frankiales bacterium]